MNTAMALPVIAGVEITTDAEGRVNLNALHPPNGLERSKRKRLPMRSENPLCIYA